MNDEAKSQEFNNHETRILLDQCARISEHDKGGNLATQGVVSFKIQTNPPIDICPDCAEKAIDGFFLERLRSTGLVPSGKKK